MGKQKGSKEAAKRARENRFDDDLTGIDDRPVLGEILLYINELYNAQLPLWGE
jgi:hypothetical protein